jgi:hypothetical protein
MSKYAIVVIASRGELYDKLIQNWINIINYVNENHKHVKIYLIFGKDSELDLVDNIKDNLIIPEYDESVFPGIIQKTMFTIEQLLEKNFDFILRTNLSSYLSVKNIDKLINNLDSKTDLVLSYPRFIDTKWPFTNKNLLDEIKSFNQKYEKNLFRSPSGAFFMISKDVAEKIIDIYNEKYKNSELISKVNDDDIIGLLLKDFNYIDAKRINIRTHNDILKDSFKQSLKNCLERKEHYHFRCKSNENRHLDVDVLDLIFKIDSGMINVEEK